MMTEKDRFIIDVLATNGKDQVIKMCEELGELITALSRWYINDRSNLDNVHEELVDVIFMTEQMRCYFGITQEEVDNRINAKIQKYKDRHKEFSK
ncbi:MAG: hypothetical protein KBT46_00700 [Ruminococcus sp.]|nr:hypothetical protein [Candidatus Copronaster equi]